jgi:hypothetical protein
VRREIFVALARERPRAKLAAVFFVLTCDEEKEEGKLAGSAGSL